MALVVAACTCSEFDSPVAGAVSTVCAHVDHHEHEHGRAPLVVPLEPLAALLCADAAQQHAYLSAVFGAGDVRAAVADVHAVADAGALARRFPGLHAVTSCAAHVDVCSDACVVRVYGLPRSVCVAAGIEMRRNRWAGALLLASLPGAFLPRKLSTTASQQRQGPLSLSIPATPCRSRCSLFRRR